MHDTNCLKGSLRELLDELDALEAVHPEVGDTVARDQLRRLLQEHLFEPQPGLQWPERLGMLSTEGDAALSDIMERFVTRARAVFVATGIGDYAGRLVLFQDGAVSSAAGSYFDDYFGHEAT